MLSQKQKTRQKKNCKKKKFSNPTIWVCQEELKSVCQKDGYTFMIIATVDTIVNYGINLGIHS